MTVADIRSATSISCLYHLTDEMNLPLIREHDILPCEELLSRRFVPPKPGGNDWSRDAAAIYRGTSREASKDERLLSSGVVIGFSFEGFELPSEPKTAFYDWLYSRALAPHKGYVARLESFAGFIDIEFNPGKSIGCQTRSCALFVSLCKRGSVEVAISSPARFMETVSADSFSQPYSADVILGRLL